MNATCLRFVPVIQDNVRLTSTRKMATSASQPKDIVSMESAQHSTTNADSSGATVNIYLSPKSDTLSWFSVVFLGGLSGDRKCFEQFNSQGSINGHCGLDNNNNYIRCEPEYKFQFPIRVNWTVTFKIDFNLQTRHVWIVAMPNGNPVTNCGRNGSNVLANARFDGWSWIRVQVKKRVEITYTPSADHYIDPLFFVSRITSGTVAAADLPDMGVVRDGTPCGNNLVSFFF